MSSLKGRAGCTPVATPPEPRLRWIAREGEHMRASRLALDESGRVSATVPVGAGTIHYATPEILDSTRILDWPTLGEAHVESGVRTVFDG